MRWYSFADIMHGYRISKASLKLKCLQGEIEYQKLPESNKTFKYVIPESELYKLEKYKFGEPEFNIRSQPGHLEELALRITSYKKAYGEISQYKKRAIEAELKYDRYIQSEEWYHKRDEALKRDGYVCQMCGTGKNLRVHHVSYMHLHTPEEMQDLVTLCEECHKKVHSKDLIAPSKECGVL